MDRVRGSSYRRGMGTVPCITRSFGQDTIVDLTTIADAPWRAFPAAALALIGLTSLAKGLWFGFVGSAGLLHERDALGWMRGFRLAVVGLCLSGIAIAWVWHIPWLFVAALGILGEELLETSVIIEVLKRNPVVPATRRVARLSAQRA